jgi:hypothetical protein
MVLASGDRLKLDGGLNPASSEKLITLAVATILTLVSIVLMLKCTSPEFSWDEADYLTNTAKHWGFLWGLFEDTRHFHGPLATDLAKLGQEVLPAWVGSLEVRLRFFEALAGSLAVGFLYWTLRLHFRTSRAAALVGSSLLLFSVIRLEETSIIGPHDLMLLCTLAVAGLGYRWRDRPTWQASLGLGGVIAFGALSMTYVIPVILCWAVAVSLVGTGWFAWDRTNLKVSWMVFVALATAATIVLAVWPPGVLQMTIIKDFWIFLHYRPRPIFVGGRIFQTAPRWAAVYWLAHMEGPIIAFSLLIALIALWKAFKRGSLSSKHAWLAIFLAFFSAAAITAHLAGARNLLQFIGVLCLAAGALFDDALGSEHRLLRSCAATAVIILAAANLAWLSLGSPYTPFFATDGYRAFLKENSDRLREPATAQVYGMPILNYYARQYGKSIAWNAEEVRWTPRADIQLPADLKYVLIPAFFYNNMPAEQPMRRVVAKHWKVVWSYRVDHAWELRLYQNPQLPSP